PRAPVPHTLSLHDALPIWPAELARVAHAGELIEDLRGHRADDHLLELRIPVLGLRVDEGGDDVEGGRREGIAGGAGADRPLGVRAPHGVAGLGAQARHAVGAVIDTTLAEA